MDWYRKGNYYMGNNDLSNYTVSIHYDRRLYREDIAGSIVHVRMLSKQSIISDDDCKAIIQGLESIQEEIESDVFPWKDDIEDIHMSVESRLFDKIGDIAGQLHTARSRNDQIALDLRMYTKDAIKDVLNAISDLRKSLIYQAESHIDVPMPGYTHLQRAQPVLFGHHMLAYFDMLGRDIKRFKQAYHRSDVMPLGSGALAGVPYCIDRDYVARELGFASISTNSMDAVSDRDFLMDFHSSAAICMIHLSRLAEEMIIWSTDEFGFIRLGDDFTTGSSIMPQKRNPDFAELARGKSGRVIGNLVGILTLLKGLPLTYNRDLQEDKEGFFDTFDTLISSINVFSAMITGMKINKEKLHSATISSNVLATDIADYLVKKGMPFRQAHGVVKRLSAIAAEQGEYIQNLPIEVYKSESKLFEEDVFSITIESSIDARNVLGGTSYSQLKKSIDKSKVDMETDIVP